LVLPLRIACSLHGSILVRQPDAAARARPPLQKVERRSTSCALALRLAREGACPSSAKPRQLRARLWRRSRGRRRAARARGQSTSPLRMRRPGPSSGLDGLGQARCGGVPFLSGAWLTLESRSSIKARRLEGLRLRMRVAVVAAPECGAAWWWCARTAFFRSTTPAPTRSPDA
jgi:hypothetical protein